MMIQDKKNLRVGLKAAMRAIKERQAEVLYIANDAEQHVLRQLLQIAEEYCVDVKYIDTKKMLGQMCHIDVGAAAAVIIKSTTH